MHQNLSLLKFCTPCKARCCKTGKSIGSPILASDEMLKIKKLASGYLKEIESPIGEKYYVIQEQKGTNRCYFLTREDKCRIQKIKPLDCLCYPIKAIYSDITIEFIIDLECPAVKYLDREFIKNAKRIALKSIKRFDKQTYQHWLNNYVGWVRKKQALKVKNSYKTKTGGSNEKTDGNRNGCGFVY